MLALLAAHLLRLILDTPQWGESAAPDNSRYRHHRHLTIKPRKGRYPTGFT